ncbi:hypothetical protein LCGC14_2330200, partial [marine sediment metagenome]
ELARSAAGSGASKTPAEARALVRSALAKPTVPDNDRQANQRVLDVLYAKPGEKVKQVNNALRDLAKDARSLHQALRRRPRRRGGSSRRSYYSFYRGYAYPYGYGYGYGYPYSYVGSSHSSIGAGYSHGGGLRINGSFSSGRSFSGTFTLGSPRHLSHPNTFHGGSITGGSTRAVTLGTRK